MAPLLAASFVAASLTACPASSNSNDRRVLRLHESGRSIYGPVPIRPGQQFAFLFFHLENHSDHEVVLRSITPDVEGEGVARLVDVEIARQPPTGPVVSQGAYFTYPPTERVAGRCRSPEVEPVAGYELPPRARSRGFALMLMRFEGLAKGAASLGPFIVSYSHEGATIEEKAGVVVKIEVDPKAERPPVIRAQKACLDKTEVLPGNRFGSSG